MEEYLKVLLEQMRCKQARKVVEDELRGHFAEQIQENREAGMTEEEAVQEAIRDMGDPVETGISLDAVHRPRISWSLLLLIGAVSLLGIGIQFLIGRGNEGLGMYEMEKHMLEILLGFGLMLLVYRLDYTFLGKHAKRLAGIFFLFLLVSIPLFSTQVNGSSAWLALPMSSISLRALLYLWIPLYGALLYQYHGTGYQGIGVCVLCMLPPVFVALRMSSLSEAVILLFLEAVLLSMAVGNGWFQVKKERFFLGFWSVFLLLPAGITALGYKLAWFAPYQMARIQNYMGQKSADASWETGIASYLAESKLWGKGESSAVEGLQSYSSDYIVTFLIAHYGFLAALFAAALVLFLIFRIFRISLKQKNQLGRMIGCASGLTFLAQTLLSVLVGMGLLPSMRCFLPLISFGGSYLLVSYILLGLVLSVYRYQDILPPEKRIQPFPGNQKRRGLRNPEAAD